MRVTDADSNRICRRHPHAACFARGNDLVRRLLSVTLGDPGGHGSKTASARDISSTDLSNGRGAYPL